MGKIYLFNIKTVLYRLWKPKIDILRYEILKKCKNMRMLFEHGVSETWLPFCHFSIKLYPRRVRQEKRHQNAQIWNALFQLYVFSKCPRTTFKKIKFINNVRLLQNKVSRKHPISMWALGPIRKWYFIWLGC